MAMQVTGETKLQQDLPQWQKDQWSNVTQGASNYVIDPATGAPRQMPEYGGPLTAADTPGYSQAKDTAYNLHGPDYATANTQMSDSAAAAQGQYRDPNVSFNTDYRYSTYDPNKNMYSGDVQYKDTLAGYKSGAEAFLGSAAQIGGPDYQASTYQFTPQQVAAMQMAGLDPNRIRDVTGVGGLEAFLMGPQSNVIAPELRDFLINNPERITAGQLDPARQWNDAERQQYMDPYAAGVIDVERRKAMEAFNEQLSQAGGRAAAAGAFGGSRQAVVEGALRRDYATQLGDITTTGLDRAYQNAQQQFERDRAAGIDTGKFNITSGLQAGIANQAAMLEAMKANQAAQLGVQALGAQTGMQAQIANQATGLASAQTNVQAQNAMRQLQANLAQQAQIANQQRDIQASGQEIDVNKANMLAKLQADLQNSQLDLEAQVKGAGMTQADKQYGFGKAQEKATSNAQFQQQQNLANQQAQMQAQELREKLGFEALQTSGEWGLKSGLANQAERDAALRSEEQSRQFGFEREQQAGQFGADYLQRGQIAGENANTARTNTNINAAKTSSDIWRDIAANDTQRFNNDLATGKFQFDVGKDEQDRAQKATDRDFALWQLQQQYPMASMAQLAEILDKMPDLTSSTTTTSAPKPSGWKTFGDFLLAGAGVASNFVSPIKLGGK